MNRRYNIMMTESAGRFYTQLALQARQEQGNGNRRSNSVAVFAFIEQALEEIMLSPLNQSRSLAGTLAEVYRFSSGQLRITYVVQPDLGQVVVYSMCFVSQSLTQFVQSAFESGKLDGLCGALGIDKSNLEDVPRSSYVN